MQLKDKTEINFRQKSKSGGSTIQTDKPEPIKIHNKAKEDGDL